MEEEFNSNLVIEETREKIQKFVQFHLKKNNRLVLISSGGTTVPLEEKTVRFLDNFSIGTRGSVSAEQFMENSYAVLYLYRKRSLAPYERKFNNLNILDMIKYSDENQNTFKIEPKNFDFRSLFEKYNKIKEKNLLLKVEFTSLFDYLSLLEFACKSIDCLKENAIVYLAAAVSDFYLPKTEMPKHKIQSSTLGLELSLKPVPKLLGKLKSEWCRNAFVVSFKLETDTNLLNTKCKQSLEKYKHNLVIGNILENRKNSVSIMKPDGLVTEIKQESNKTEIEELIINYLIDAHTNFKS